MGSIYIFSHNTRLSSRWQDLLLQNNEIQTFTDFDELKKLLNEETLIVFHDDRDKEIIIEELDVLYEIIQKKHALVLRSIPDLEEGELLLSHDIGGYGNANMSDDVFLQAIEALKSGNVWLYPDLMAHIIKKLNNMNSKSEMPEWFNSLTDREKEVALLIANGETNQMIADDLHISQNTVKLHISAIFRKLNIKNRVALAILFKGIS